MTEGRPIEARCDEARQFSLCWLASAQAGSLQQSYRFAIESEHVLGTPGLNRIILNDDTHENVGIGGDLHNWPAHPFSMATFISSIETVLCPSRLSMPNASEILPARLTARTRSSPPGNWTTSTFCPGRTPKCWSSSFFNVIWHLAVTVSTFIGGLRSPHIVVIFALTFELNMACV